MALSRMLAASGVMSDLSQSKNTIYGPGVHWTGGGGGAGSGGGAGIGAGSGGGGATGSGSGAPKLNTRPPMMLCERKRPNQLRPATSTSSAPGALKKRYFSDTSMLSDSGAR